MSEAEAHSKLDLETLIRVMRARTKQEHMQAQHESIEAELKKEMAAAFGRANDKVADAIAKVVAAGEGIDCARDAEARSAAVLRYATLREAALRARWELRVHRDALGLAWTEEVRIRTRVPGPRT